MPRPKKPEAAKAPDGQEVVKDLPPANPFNEPIADTYSDGANAEITQGTTKPAETIVEHPLSPTDANPNPHGTREQPVTQVFTKEEGLSHPAEGSIQIEGTFDHADGVHLGDGRVLKKGERAKVTKDIANDPGLKGKIKRV